ncbi:LppX_LprAFG lipoprotein [Actinokineospora terrae]|uniref:Lipoprotein LprG n=1 Tax=Actinokineospora terrae TaxID=155974 RepID=A0A1H9SJ82_9PSEU|nr:LppX_LprAFG lipoprotein [Actinokineospora terrae]SER84423.1 Protein of unknown function [Actinokineospora terrae]
MGFFGKSRLFAAVAVAAALTLTGCSGGGTPQSGGTGASQPTNEAKKSAFDTLRGLTDAVKAKSTSAKSAHFTLTGDMAGQSMTGEGDFTFGGTANMQMSMKTPDGEVSVRLLDSIMYIKTPTEVEPGKSWVKLDLTDKDNPLVAMLGKSLDSARQADPTATLEQLADVSEITAVKAEEVNGQQTTRYTLTVDVTKLGGKAGELGMDEAAVAQLGTAGVKTFPADIWINGDDLPVRYAMELPVGAKKVTMKVDYTDWGKTVDIAAPPAAEVAELPAG